MGPVSRITFFLSCLCRSQHTFQIPDGDRNPHGGQEGRRRRFLTLMVGAPGSPSAPPRGAAVDNFNVDDGRFRIYSSDTFQGVAVDVS
jgi:hypothetical protein